MTDLDSERVTAANAVAARSGYRIEVELDDDKTTYLAVAYALDGAAKPRPLCRRATALEALEDGVEALRSQG